MVLADLALPALKSQ